ncbi:MAG: oligosaccharide flippase family protein [Candidatus Latescibacterota bacterium]
MARRMLLMGGINLLSAGRGILLLPVLTRALAPRDFGLYTQLVILLQVLVPVATLGLESAVLRYLAGEKDRTRLRPPITTTLAAALGGALALAAGCWLLRGWLGERLFGTPGAGVAEELLLWVFPLLVLHAAGVLATGYFRAVERFAWYGALTLVDALLYLLLAVLWAGPHGVPGVLWALAIGKGLVCLVGVGEIGRSTGIGGIRPGLLRSYLRFSLPILPGVFLYFCIQYGDRYVLLLYRPLEDVARYNAAYTFGGIVSLVFAPFFQVVTPRASALWNQGRRDEAGARLEQAMRYSVALVLPVLFGVAAFAGPVGRLYAPAALAVDRGTLAMITVAYALLMVRAWGRVVLTLEERSRTILGIEAASVAANLLLNLALVPSFGIAGAAAATLLTFAAQLGAYGYLTRAHLRYGPQVVFALKGVAAAAAMVLAMRLVGAPDGPRAVACLAAGGLVWAGVLYLVGGVGPQEVRMLWGALPLALRRRLPLAQPR